MEAPYADARRGPLAARLHRVLIVRLSALGDCVHVLPALDALRRGLPPGARIGWLVEEKAASLVRGLPQVDRVHVLPRSKALGKEALRRPWAAAAALAACARELRAERYDATIDCQSNLRSSLAALASGARLRVGLAQGYAKEASHVLRNRNVVPRLGKRAHKVERYLDVVASLGIDVRGARPVLAIPSEARAKARAFFEASFAPGVPVVALHPGVSAAGALKQWAPEKFAATADLLAREAGARTLLTWGPGERSLAESVLGMTAATTGALLAPETRSILELAALYERSTAVLGCDTGPIQLAAAIGARVVGLYGPKDPVVYAPWLASGERAEVVWKGVHCSPCTLRRCGDVICMREIAPADAFDAVRRALARG